MKLGIIQGRLSTPTNNHIQEFPFHNWKNEFELLKELGLNHIEWIITKNSYQNNPLFLENLNDLPISSVCCDHIIDNNIHNFNFLKNELYDVCEYSIRNKIFNISIPLLEQSNMENDLRRKEFIDSILLIKNKFKQLNFIFETELDPYKTLEIVKSDKNFYVTYDTGNVTSYLKNHELYINVLKDKIINVHIKDRTFDSKTVYPLTGDTNFNFIFDLLNKVGYNSLYTMQLARTETGKEIEHISNCKNIFEGLYGKYFV
jgi:hypothetical protein